MLPLGDSFCNSNQHLRVKGITPLKIAHERRREVTADAGLPSARNVILHMQEILNMDAIDRLFGEEKKKALIDSSARASSSGAGHFSVEFTVNLN